MFSGDFGETLPGLWECDVERQSANLVIAGRANGFSPREREWWCGRPLNRAVDDELLSLATCVSC
ncbi:DUF2252 family protein [Streptomyces canus]|uniref:DUF2252 family protein n=1 Tax=Streptomyces canus TaxID=58343 RepID=UPI003F4C2DC2